MKFAEQIKRQRKKLGMTQTEVAEKLYVTRQTISNWEQSKNYPDLNMLVKISDVYQISIDSLLKEDPGLKNYLDQGRAVNAFEISNGLIWILMGLDRLIVSFSSFENQVAQLADTAICIIFALAFVYEEYKMPFFLGISTRLYNRKGKRPDQKLSLIGKRFRVCFLLAVIGGLFLDMTHKEFGPYVFTTFLIILGIERILNKYMYSYTA